MAIKIIAETDYDRAVAGILWQVWTERPWRYGDASSFVMRSEISAALEKSGAKKPWTLGEMRVDKTWHSRIRADLPAATGGVVSTDLTEDQARQLIVMLQAALEQEAPPSLYGSIPE